MGDLLGMCLALPRVSQTKKFKDRVPKTVLTSIINCKLGVGGVSKTTFSFSKWLGLTEFTESHYIYGCSLLQGKGIGYK